MPLVALYIRLGRQGRGRKVGGEGNPGIGVFQGPVPYRKLEDRDVDLRFEEKLDALPSNKSFLCESWHRRRRVVVISREVHMLTTLDLVDVRDGLRGHLDEKT